MAALRTLLFVAVVASAVTDCTSLIPRGNVHIFPRRSVTSASAGTQTNSVEFVELISVEKTPIQQGNRFTLRYRKHTSEDIMILYHSAAYIGKAPDQVIIGDDGVSSAIFTIAESSQDDIFRYIVFDDADFSKSVVLSLKVSGSEHELDTISGQPTISITPDDQASYRPGQDVNISVSGQTPDGINVTSLDFDTHFMGVDLQTRIFHQYVSDRDFITGTDPRFHGNTVEASATVHTGQRPMSGYFQLTAEIEPRGTDLVESIQIGRSLLIKPYNQTGPFPTGYLALVDTPSAEVSTNGNELKTCLVGQECKINCQAVGERVSGLEVYQIQPDGAITRVPNTVPYPVDLEISKLVTWTFTARADSGDSDGITTFECRATDDTRGNIVTKSLDVQAIILPSIDSSLSVVAIEDDPMCPECKNLTLRCVIRGRPLPDVTFSGSLAWNNFVYDLQPDTVTPTSNANEAIASKTFSINVDDFNWIAREVRAGRGQSLSCSSYSMYNGEFLQHFFQIDEIC